MNVNRGPYSVNMGLRNVIMGPLNVDRGPWNVVTVPRLVVMGPRNVNRGPWNVNSGLGMWLWDLVM